MQLLSLRRSRARRRSRHPRPRTTRDVPLSMLHCGPAGTSVCRRSRGPPDVESAGSSHRAHPRRRGATRQKSRERFLNRRRRARRASARDGASNHPKGGVPNPIPDAMRIQLPVSRWTAPAGTTTPMSAAGLTCWLFFCVLDLQAWQPVPVTIDESQRTARLRPADFASIKAWSARSMDSSTLTSGSSNASPKDAVTLSAVPSGLAASELLARPSRTREITAWPVARSVPGSEIRNSSPPYRNTLS